MLIQGIHHVCIKCRKDEIEKVKHFYGELLGLPILRSWGETELEGFMRLAMVWWKYSPTRRMACHRAVSDILPSKQTMWINV